MAQYHNPTPGARGINLKDGTVRLVEAGQSVDLDAGDVIAAHPDIKTDAKQADTKPGLTGKTKPELLEIAEKEGVTIEDGATVPDIRSAIELHREG